MFFVKLFLIGLFYFYILNTSPSEPFLEITLAGIPPIVMLFLTKLLLTTALAPITQSSPIFIEPKYFCPWTYVGVVYLLLGRIFLYPPSFLNPAEPPMFTPACILQFFPILASVIHNKLIHECTIPNP